MESNHDFSSDVEDSDLSVAESVNDVNFMGTLDPANDESLSSSDHLSARNSSPLRILFQTVLDKRKINNFLDNNEAASKTWNGACIGSVAQITVIGFKQTKVNCSNMRTKPTTTQNNNKYRFGQN